VSAPWLEVAGLCKSFGGRAALSGVDLEVGREELLVVLGPTGAGKTTLLRTLAGLVVPDAGTVRLEGRDLLGVSPAERDVALVFQNFSLYPRWSVRDNLAFPLRAPGRRLSAAEIDERVAWAAGLLRIERLLDRPARRLSGGEMQRVAIGRAIVRRPRLFLMDEPLTNLDAKLREALRIELVELVRALKTPMVYVTHDQAEALSMADRIVVLHAGRVLQQGPPRGVYLAPATPLVARQLGAPPINLFEAHCDGERWFAREGTPLCAAQGEAVGAGLLGVRPEHLAPFGGDDEGRVLVVEDTGPARILLVRWAGADVHLCAPRELELKPGDAVAPRIDPTRVLVWRENAPSERPAR
jgi:multiple sugar transport system ATP-binding protein